MKLSEIRAKAQRYVEEEFPYLVKDAKEGRWMNDPPMAHQLDYEAGFVAAFEHVKAVMIYCEKDNRIHLDDLADICTIEEEE